MATEHSMGHGAIWAATDGFVAALLAQARIGIAFFDTSRRFVYVNAVLADMNGVSGLDHLGRTVDEVTPGVAAEVNGLLERALAGERVLFDLAAETPAAPGVLRTWSEEWFPARNDDGEIVGAVAMVRELTDQLRQEAELARVTAELTTVFETAPVGLALFDRSLALIRMNHLLGSWHEIGPDAIGRRPEEIIPNLWPSTSQHFERALAGEESSIELTPSGLPGPGAPTSVARTYSPVRLHDEVVGVVVTVTDISAFVEREHVAQRAVRLQEELVRLASHEIRTPLTAVIGMAQRLERLAGRAQETPIGTAQEDLLLIRAEGERIARTLESITSAVDLAEGKLELRREPVALETFIARAIRIVRERYREFVVQLQTPEPLTIYSDGDRLLQVLLNLLENAAKYGAGSAAVEVRRPGSPEERAERIEIIVKDNGPGIPPEEQERIFERGFRGSTSDRATGSGLGLHYARALAEALGGSLLLESVVGSGSSFIVRLPLRRD